jgi:hypothetical protein
MIALLALRPLRICNFVNLRLQDNLFIQCDCMISISNTRNKNGQYLEFPYPNELFSRLSRYIRKIRPIFIRGTASPYLCLFETRGANARSRVAENN